MEYFNAFLCGGILCAIGQILIDKTQLTPARILTGYVVAGVILSAAGLYEPLAQWGDGALDGFRTLAGERCAEGRGHGRMAGRSDGRFDCGGRRRCGGGIFCRGCSGFI